MFQRDSHIRHTDTCTLVISCNKYLFEYSYSKTKGYLALSFNNLTQRIRRRGQRSSTKRAIGPKARHSRAAFVNLNTKVSFEDTAESRWRVCLWPNTPQKAAGCRILPAMSAPRPKTDASEPTCIQNSTCTDPGQDFSIIVNPNINSIPSGSRLFVRGGLFETCLFASFCSQCIFVRNSINIYVHCTHYKTE